MTFKTEDEAVQLANDSEYGLAGEGKGRDGLGAGEAGDDGGVEGSEGPGERQEEQGG